MMDFGKHKQVVFVGNSQFQFRADWGWDFLDDGEMDYLPPPLSPPYTGGMKGGESWAAPEPSPYPPPQPGPMAEEMLKQVNLLADFAFYAGTGLKATMGMGQTRRLG
jgi:hypothetical protein